MLIHNTMKSKNIIKKIIHNLGYITIIGGIIVGEKIKSGAPWINIIRSELSSIILIIIIAVIVELVLRINRID